MNIPALVGQAFAIAKSFNLAADVTFTLVTQAHTPSTGVMSAPVTATVSGTAVRIDGDANEYERLGLTEREPITLEFGPATVGEKPPLLSTCSWEGETRTVAKVYPTAPGGSALVTKVIVTI